MSEPGERRGNGKPSRWEWVAAAVSTAMVVAVVGYLLYQAVGKPNTPPLLHVRADSVLRAGDGWLVQFRVDNRGRTTAAGVGVEGTLRQGGGEVEKSETTIDYVPSRSHRTGGLYFTRDPGRHTLELRPTGYDDP
ncbi:MAG TPA: TIGR02588 family protein [Longimicrobium sp.]|nr:TIGR02588 family protein [Longimicrobium sp.]